jgi:hypothetical protein
MALGKEGCDRSIDVTSAYAAECMEDGEQNPGNHHDKDLTLNVASGILPNNKLFSMQQSQDDWPVPITLISFL